MQFDYAGFAALAAVLRSGSFHTAADRLGVTASAVSQRIKQLEERFGGILVIRGKPCRPSPMGNRLLRHIEALEVMETQLTADLDLSDGSGSFGTIRIGVNADSLATWFIDAMQGLPNTLCELVICDQDFSDELLREGQVAVAITGTDKPVQGCDLMSLGLLPYAATASPGYMAQYFPDGPDENSLRAAPSLRFSDRDQLQAQWIRETLGLTLQASSHMIPTTNGFVDACLAGLGWGLNPLVMVEDHIAAGRLVELLPGRRLSVPLYWQVMRNQKQALAPLTQSVRNSAARHLLPLK